MTRLPTVLTGVFALYLLCAAVRAQGPAPDGTLQEADLDGMVAPVLLCGPKIGDGRVNFYQRVLNTGADPTKKVVYYSTYLYYASFDPMAPRLTPDAISYAAACSANVADKTIGNTLWVTNVTTLPDGRQDGLGRGVRLLRNSSALISFERASYNRTSFSGVFYSSNLAVLDAKTGSKIASLPIDPANPNRLFQVSDNIVTTSNNLNVFLALDDVSREVSLWPAGVSPDASIRPAGPLRIQGSAPSSESSIVYDTVVTGLPWEQIIGENGSVFSEAIPGVLTVIALDPLTGKVEQKINLTSYHPDTYSLTIDEASDDVYVTGLGLGDIFKTGLGSRNKVTLTRLNMKASSQIWNHSYTAQLLDSNATAILDICGSTYVEESRRVVMALDIRYPWRAPVSSNETAARENPRVSVTRDSSGAKETFIANPVPETANQKSRGVNQVDILVLVIEGSTGQLNSARIVGTPFNDICRNVEYAGDGVLALFGNFPSIYIGNEFSERQPSQYPVLFDVTDAGKTIGGNSNANQTSGTGGGTLNMNKTHYGCDTGGDTSAENHEADEEEPEC